MNVSVANHTSRNKSPRFGALQGLVGIYYCKLISERPVRHLPHIFNFSETFCRTPPYHQELPDSTIALHSRATMICRHCRILIRSQGPLYRSFTASSPRFYSAASPTTAAAQAKSLDGEAATPAAGGKESKKNATTAAIISSVPAGTPLKGLNFVKGAPDPVALEDHEYPDWLWTLLASKGESKDQEGEMGDLFCKFSSALSYFGRSLCGFFHHSTSFRVFPVGASYFTLPIPRAARSSIPTQKLITLSTTSKIQKATTYRRKTTEKASHDEPRFPRSQDSALRTID